MAQGGIVPLIPADDALQGQAGLAKAIRNRCDVCAFDVRQQATDREFGVLSGGLTLEGCDKGFHEGAEAWDDRLENLWGQRTFVKQLAFAKGVSRFHGRSFCDGCVFPNHRSDLYTII
jgi:hypothetical protein